MKIVHAVDCMNVYTSKELKDKVSWLKSNPKALFQKLLSCNGHDNRKELNSELLPCTFHDGKAWLMTKGRKGTV